MSGIDQLDWEVIEAMAEDIRQAIQRKKRRENERDALRECRKCNPTAKAMERVRDQWTVAGIE